MLETIASHYYWEGAYETGGGGHVKFYPYENWGADNILAMLKGGGVQQVLG